MLNKNRLRYLVRRFEEAMNARQLDALDEVVAGADRLA